MPIPLQNLDDRTFTDLVDELRALIPRHSTAWTNYNISDPGIMFMELFAWLTENTIYRINRITPASRMRFLELLGGIFQSAQPAVIRLTVTGKGISKPYLLPRGTQIQARTERNGTSIPFETITDLTLTPATPTGSLTARQSQLVAEEAIGVGNGLAYQRLAIQEHAIILPRAPFPQRPKVIVNGERWDYRPTLRNSQKEDQHFTIKPWLNVVAFGDGTHGRAVPTDATIKVTYRTDAERYRVVRDEIVQPYQNRLGQLYQLQYPLLALDLQTADEFEPQLVVNQRQWHYRPSFLEIDQDAEEFTVEPWANIVRLGNDCNHGRVPSADTPLTLTYRHTLGSQGNLPLGSTFVMANRITDGTTEFVIDPDFKIVSAGVDRTDLAEARDEVFALLKPRWRTITTGDYQGVITNHQPDVVNVAPVPARNLGATDPKRYRPGYTSVILTAGPRYELVEYAATLGTIYQVSPDGRRLLTQQKGQSEEQGAATDPNEKRALDCGCNEKRSFDPNQNSASHSEQNITGGDAQMWDMETKQRIRAFTVPALRKADFHPLGQQFVTSNEAQIAQLWDARDGSLITFLQPTVRLVGWQSDSQTVITVDNSGHIALWQNAANEPPTTFSYQGQESLLALSRNGTRLATATPDQVVTLRELAPESASAQVTLSHPDASITALALSADGLHLAVTDVDCSLFLYDAQSGEMESYILSSAPITAIALDTTGARLALATSDCIIILWDVAEQEILASVAAFAPLNLLTFSDNDRLLTAADSDGFALTWDFHRDEGLIPIDHGTLIQTLAVAPNGNRLATTGSNGMVHLWDLQTGKALATLAHGGAVHTMAFRPDGRQLATAGVEGALRIWDVAKAIAFQDANAQSIGTVPALFEGHDRLHVVPICQYHFAHRKALLVTVAQEQRAWLWNVADGTVIRTLSTPSPVTEVRFSPDDRWLATYHGDGMVRLWQADTGQETALYPHAAAVSDFQFDPTGEQLATVDETGLLRLWMTAPAPPLSYRLHDSPIYDVAFLPEEIALATRRDDNKAEEIWRIPHRWSLQEAPSRHVIPTQGPTDQIFLSHDGAMLALTAGKRFQLWRADGQAAEAAYEFPEPIQAVAFSSADELRYVAIAQKLYQWPPTKYLVEDKTEKPTSFPATIGAFHFEDTTFFVALIADNTVTVYDYDGTSIQSMGLPLPHPETVHAVSFSSDGQWLVTAAADKTVRVWDWATGEELMAFAQPLPIHTLAADATEGQLMTVDSEQTVRLWRMRAPKPVVTRQAASQVTALRYSSDGTRLVTWGTESAATLWSTRTGKVLAHLADVPKEPINERALFAFDPTGYLLAVFLQCNSNSAPQANGETANCVRLWNVRTGEQLADLSPISTTPEAMVFSADGKHLIVLAANQAHIWTRWERHLTRPTFAHRTLPAAGSAKTLWLHQGGEWLAIQQNNLLSIHHPERMSLQRNRGPDNTFYHEHDAREVCILPPQSTGSNQLVTWFDSGPQARSVRTVRVWNAQQINDAQSLLTERKLVTNQQYVAGVTYCDVAIKATVVSRNPVRQPQPMQERIVQQLRRFFHPHLGGPDGKGWPLGRTVYASEVYQIIEGVEGVDHVEHLEIDYRPAPADTAGGSAATSATSETLGATGTTDQQAPPTDNLSTVLLDPNALVNCFVTVADLTITSPDVVTGRSRQQRR